MKFPFLLCYTELASSLLCKAQNSHNAQTHSHFDGSCHTGVHLSSATEALRLNTLGADKVLTIRAVNHC